MEGEEDEELEQEKIANQVENKIQILASSSYADEIALNSNFSGPSLE